MPGTEKWNANTDDGLLLGFGGGFGGFFVYVWGCFFWGGKWVFVLSVFCWLGLGFIVAFFVDWFACWFHLVCLLEVVHLTNPFLFPPCPTSSWPWASRYHKSLICCSYGGSFSEPSLWLWQDRSLWFWNSSLKTNKKRKGEEGARKRWERNTYYTVFLLLGFGAGGKGLSGGLAAVGRKRVQSWPRVGQQ